MDAIVRSSLQLQKYQLMMVTSKNNVTQRLCITKKQLQRFVTHNNFLRQKSKNMCFQNKPHHVKINL